jgi:hypothetical protein
MKIEEHLQKLANEKSSTQCSTCTNICCKEEICRESIHSDFLKFILNGKSSEYNHTNGWFNTSSGCTLKYGRPLVCYEFFCSKFDSDSNTNILQKVSKDFGQLYSKVYRNQHILEIENIFTIPENKLKKLLNKLNVFHTNLNIKN